MSEENPIVAYKGFDENFKCRGFQYEVGKTYKHKGEVSACNSGFHSCTNPWDVLSYYDVTQKFALVAAHGKQSTHDSDSKIASAKITIEAELKLPEFIRHCIDFIKVSCKQNNLGDSSQLAASGDSSQLAASGDYSQLAASGDYSKLAASGDSSKLAASGDSSQLAASGYFSQLAASGDSSKLAASGYFSQLAASGDSSKLAASGDSSQLAASGDYSIAISSGENSKIKAGKNGAMALSRWVEKEKRFRISVAYVGEEGIREDVWYQLDGNGKFIQIQD